MLKKEIESKKQIKFDKSFIIPEDYEYNNVLIKNISDLKVKGELNYQSSIKGLQVQAIILATIEAIDARDGSIIVLENQEFEWDDEYFFENVNDDQHNLILGEEFSILDYAIDQILLNIPMNLTNNYGKISLVGKNFKLMTEEEYEQEQENEIDPRWDKLNDFKFKK
ncbi:hypothetical protein SHELI_v1c07230 [Spiroplasma helicoides]|uniref:DUF177 domain-containing protein n=1 Tax=Spiroplasma helicoides TaxID=216938 RepID=A0A1B3SL68_9MOLU|nr:YceD family protein [Spiroplasma helicoides]AOG60672.1 hypothetical protein SHELI_v1c07230 [Spiroplasma helicoides]